MLAKGELLCRNYVPLLPTARAWLGECAVRVSEGFWRRDEQPAGEVGEPSPKTWCSCHEPEDCHRNLSSHHILGIEG
jgi:hypothetical protein